MQYYFIFNSAKLLQSILENVQKLFTKYICPRGISYSQRGELLSDMSIKRRYMISRATTNR